jgi:hypothetical protein
MENRKPYASGVLIGTQMRLRRVLLGGCIKKTFAKRSKTSKARVLK